jgi:hypothetical protein
MDVWLLCLYVVLSCVGRGLCDGMITRPEESYRVSVCVWDQETPKGALCSKVGTTGKMTEWLQMNTAEYSDDVSYARVQLNWFVRLCGKFIAISFFVFGRSLFQISAPGNRLSWLGVWRVFWVPPGESRNSTLKLGHELFLPTPFQFIIIHLLSYHQDVVFYFRYGLNS